MATKRRLIIIESDDEEEIVTLTKKAKTPQKKQQTKFSIDSDTKFVTAQKTICALKAKQEEWICQGVPCVVISGDEEFVRLKPFNKSGIFNVQIEVFHENFVDLKRDESFVYVEQYPGGKIPIAEFNVSPLSISELKKYFRSNQSLVKLLEKAEQDSFVGKGNTFCINISDFHRYNSKNESTKLERVGDPIFNRAARHTTPIPSTFTREDFEKSPGFPAPMGIRAEDFTLPSEQNDILREMLTQIFNCVNAPVCPEKFCEQLGIKVNPNSHMCEWCGEKMDISELNQEYCSKEHSVNFCHRDPVVGTRKGNVYIGHCSCNREQGGYSEEQRIMQIIRLAKYNPLYREMILNELK